MQLALSLLSVVLVLFPILTFGLQCYTCNATLGDYAPCSKDQKPEKRECTHPLPANKHYSCQLKEELTFGVRDIVGLGCTSMKNDPEDENKINSPRCFTAFQDHHSKEPNRTGIYSTCVCETDLCNSYENSIHCLACAGNPTGNGSIEFPGGGGRSTDYECKDGEEPHFETRCPIDLQACMYKYVFSTSRNKMTTFLGCASDTYRYNNWKQSFYTNEGCYYFTNEGEEKECYCDTSLCNTRYYKSTAKSSASLSNIHPHVHFVFISGVILFLYTYYAFVAV